MPMNPEKREIIKHELEYVVEETERKVEKLERASDIHIGTATHQIILFLQFL